MYNWHTVKSVTHKWKKCSHVCLLTFMLKREGGLGRASVSLKVDWSVPALKSSQLVSSTVRCLVWWSWWILYSLWHQHFLIPVTVVCLICTKLTVMISVHHLSGTGGLRYIAV